MAQGFLGSVFITTPATPLSLFTSGAAGVLQTFNVIFSNQNAGTARVRLYIGSGSVPAAINNIWYDLEIPGNRPAEQTGLVCSANEKVWVQSDLANVSVRAHGV